MSKPIFEDLFKFSGRRNRQSYILLTIVLMFALVVLTMLSVYMLAWASSAASLGYIFFLACLGGIVAVVWASWASGGQRIRDFGKSGVWILITLVPYIGWIVCIAIMMVPSDPGKNQYGDSCI